MFPPLREESDITEIAKALRDGVVDAITTDHTPVSSMEKDIEFDLAIPGISGLETAFGLSMRLVERQQVDLATLIERFTIGPVRAWALDRQPGLEGLGSLTPGGVGDLLVIDPAAEWTVDPETFSSLGRNTPLAGETLTGQVIATIFDGELAYKNKSLTAL